LPDLPAVRHIHHIIVACALLSTLHCALAQNMPPAVGMPRQDHAVLRQTVEQFLITQTTGLPGAVSVVPGPIDPRLSLPACAAPEAFLPNGGRAWGRTTVGLRCNAPTPWTIYVAATVHVEGEYIAAAVPLAQGQSIGPNDVAKMKGDLSAMPPGVITDTAQAIGQIAARSVNVGMPLRQDGLRTQQAVQNGQQVRLLASGPGFKVATEGRAMGNGNDGQIIQARTPTGQIVSGVARLGGIIEVAY
jgi:flagella basal body P-ring formation protein FlgA